MPNWNVEQLGRAFILLSFLMAALSMLRAVVYAQKLHTYMKSHHFDRWKEFLGEGTALFRNICLKPLNSDKSTFTSSSGQTTTLGIGRFKNTGGMFEHGCWGISSVLSLQ